jgi:hypothetical protein
MNDTNTGGSAFPVQSIYIEDQETNTHGMTLRDYFAAKAMQADISRNGYYSRDDLVERQAVNAYKMADAMLKAREA